MDTVAIRYFLDLGRCLNFSQAAEENSISQSSFSKTIKRLENELNVQLVDRTTHPITLTEAGSFFYDRMCRLEPEFSAVLRDLSEMGNQRVLRLLISPGSFRYKMALEEYMQANPGVRVMVEDLSDQSKVTEYLRAGGYDCAITPMPLAGAGDFAVQELYTDSLYCICAQSHPLAKRTAISLKELDGETFLETGHSGALARELCSRYGLVKANVVFMSRGQLRREEAMQRIAMNRGVGIYHGRDLMPYRGFGLHCAAIAEISAMPVVYLVRQGIRNEKAARELGCWLRENLERYAPEKMCLEKFNKDG